MIVAIDGPAASGKSSTAAWVARLLGMRHLDSGSLYRAITAARLRESRGEAEWTEKSLLAAAARCTLAPSASSFVPSIDGELAEAEVRSDAVTRRVSAVAQVHAVRTYVNTRLRELAREGDTVIDGRDIGTTVFPDATLKIFLVADPWERARRRLMQTLGRAPEDDEIAQETESLVQRDARDATQSSPARDAILIDTTHLAQSEQVDRIVALVRAVAQRGDA